MAEGDHIHWCHREPPPPPPSPRSVVVPPPVPSSAVGVLFGIDLDPITAGSVAGLANYVVQRIVQRWYHWKTSTVAVAVPRLRTTVPSVAIYFTMYEYLKHALGVASGELGYSRHVKHEVYQHVHNHPIKSGQQQEQQQQQQQEEGEPMEFCPYHGHHPLATTKSSSSSSSSSPADDSTVDQKVEIVSHLDCHGPFTLQRSAAYFTAAAGAGAAANLTSLFLNRIPLWYTTLNTIQSPSTGIFRNGGPLASVNVAAFANLGCTALRFGIQFTIFEQTKNYCASYHPPGSDLSPVEVLSTALLGGVVAVAAVHPLQRTISCRLPCGLPSSFTCNMVPKLPISRKSLTKCMIRFAPTCVFTAVTYEFAARGLRAIKEEKHTWKKNAIEGGWNTAQWRSWGERVWRTSGMGSVAAADSSSEAAADRRRNGTDGGNSMRTYM